MNKILSNKTILITGGTGLIGTNLAKRFAGFNCKVIASGSKQDLRSADVCDKLFAEVRPEIVFHLAAKVGGIYANSNYKAEFYSDNVLINTNTVNSCVKYKVKYIFAMGTGCAYPKKLENNVLYEDDYLDGIPEATNDAYAYAKRGLLVHLEALKQAGVLDYVFCLPANIYGPHDNFHQTHSHVIPGLIRRFLDAQKGGLKNVKVWGDGSAKRDFLFIDDCIDAIIQIVNNGCSGTYNISTGVLTSIRQVVEDIKKISGFDGVVEWDTNMPSGQMQRIFDDSKMRAIGWRYNINLFEGLVKTIEWFNDSNNKVRL